MAGPNGVALIGARRLRVQYETKTYPVDLMGGMSVTFTGWVSGPGCKIGVQIAVDDAWAEYFEDLPDENDQASLHQRRLNAKLMKADRMLRRNLLCAVLYDEQGKPMPAEIADVLASDDGGPWQEILIELGWITRTDRTEATPEGEAPAGEQIPSTGDTDSPASSSPTPARTRSR